MTRRRWIADEVDLSKRRAYLLGEHAAHLSRVLRAKIGQKFDVVVNGSGRSAVFEGTISLIEPSRVEFYLGAESQSSLPDQTQIHLFISIFKFDRMEWAVEKATELGVASITPLIARRTERHLAASAEKRLERWRRIALQASQQARRSAVPDIVPPSKLDSAIAKVQGPRIVLSETEHDLPLQRALESGAHSSLTLATGPEGGWTADELDEFNRAGWTPASLGPAILRAETAIIASLAICMSSLQATNLKI